MPLVEMEMKMIKSNLRKLRWVGLGLLLIAALALIAAYSIYPPEFINRILRWGDADVYDYQKFPERVLKTSGPTFEFSLHLEEDHNRTQFEAVGGAKDFDRFLEKPHPGLPRYPGRCHPLRAVFQRCGARFDCYLFFHGKIVYICADRDCEC